MRSSPIRKGQLRNYNLSTPKYLSKKNIFDFYSPYLVYPYLSKYFFSFLSDSIFLFGLPLIIIYSASSIIVGTFESIGRISIFYSLCLCFFSSRDIGAHVRVLSSLSTTSGRH
jgi:hypothetical protein